MFSVLKCYNINTTCQSITQHFILYTIKIVYCQGDMFRPLLGHLQALCEKTDPRAIYISMHCNLCDSLRPSCRVQHIQTYVFYNHITQSVTIWDPTMHCKCTWLQNSEMDICHSSILKFLQLGVEIPDSFWNARKGTINKHIHTFLTQWQINCNLQLWKRAFRSPLPPLPPLHSWIHCGTEAITHCSKLLGWLQYVANLHLKSGVPTGHISYTLACR